MKSTKPKVYLLAATNIKSAGVLDWLADLGGEQCLEHILGTAPEKLIELAARRCYKSFAPDLNPNVKKVRTDSADYHRNILAQAHGSVLEHSSATFAFEFVSRVFTHELVRHRAGVAYSQESLRYVRLTDLGFGMPECIASNPEAAREFTETVEYLEGKQKRLAEIFGIDSMTDFGEKKVLTSAFRRIAPIGLSTGIVMTANFRTLRWLIEHRTTPAAEAEIRIVMGEMARIAQRNWPMVFGDFQEGSDGTWTPEFRKV